MPENDTAALAMARLHLQTLFNKEDDTMYSPTGEALSSKLEYVAEAIKDHVIFQSGHDADAIALWIVGTYFMDHWSRFPKLLIVSPERECGKTTALQAIEAFARKAKLASSITPSALYRLIEHEAPTLLIDEADLTLKSHEELQAIVNAGHTKRGARKIISRKTLAGDWEPVEMSLWCPQVIAGIGDFSDTLTSRSIVIGLRRKGVHEEVAYLNDSFFDVQQTVRSELENLSQSLAESLSLQNPVLPPQVGNRMKDNWLPMLQIAQIAGAEWVERGNAALQELELNRKVPLLTGSDLLQDLQTILKGFLAPEISGCELVQQLLVAPDSDWKSANRGREITAKWLAAKLKPYGIQPYRRSHGNVYMLADLHDTFMRYLPTI